MLQPIITSGIKIKTTLDTSTPAITAAISPIPAKMAPHRRPSHQSVARTWVTQERPSYAVGCPRSTSLNISTSTARSVRSSSQSISSWPKAVSWGSPSRSRSRRLDRSSGARGCEAARRGERGRVRPGVPAAGVLTDQASWRQAMPSNRRTACPTPTVPGTRLISCLEGELQACPWRRHGQWLPREGLDGRGPSHVFAAT